MTWWTAILLVFGVIVVLGLIFGVIAPWITRLGKRERGPSSRR